MDYCEGYYTPGPVPNATLPLSHIHKETASCSNKSGLFQFDPRTILQRELNNSGHSYISIEQLQWPDDIDIGIHQLQKYFKSAYVFYVVSIVSILIAIISQVVSIFWENKHFEKFNGSKMFFTWFGSAIASGVSTAFAVQATDLINKDGKQAGISATQSTLR